MLPWSSSRPSTSSPTAAAAPRTSPPPPSSRAQRPSTSSPTFSTSSTSKGKAAAAAEPTARDDVWNEDSDDDVGPEETVVANASTPTQTAATEDNGRQRPLQPARSWSSFIPTFGLLGSGAAPATDDGGGGVGKVPIGPEAVAAALKGQQLPATAPREGRASSKERVVQQDERKLPPAMKERRGSEHGVEDCKRALKSDHEDIVNDPLTLLKSFPPCTPSPKKSHRPRVSISSDSGVDIDPEGDPSSTYAPLNALSLSSATHPAVVEATEETREPAEVEREKRRRARFVTLLAETDVDLAELRKLAWSGIPHELRPIAWQLLLGYLPAPSARRLPTLKRKRAEYVEAVKGAFEHEKDQAIWHQITIDVPRTRPGVRLWMGKATQRSLERVLYVWAIRHPASGYVQGINDLVTPFFEVFLSSYINMEPESYDVSALPPHVLDAIEADSFWCLSKLLDGIQDNYIFAQPGIHRQVAKMRELCARVDAPLSYHLEEHNVEFMQFAFRWVNCLLMRELSVKNIIRMWDTYLAEGADAFSEFHLYVCLAFLVKWSDQLRSMDFQSIIMFLQSLPTQDWDDKNTELLLSEAFMWSRTFEAR